MRQKTWDNGFSREKKIPKSIIATGQKDVVSLKYLKTKSLFLQQQKNQILYYKNTYFKNQPKEYVV